MKDKDYQRSPEQIEIAAQREKDQAIARLTGLTFKAAWEQPDLLLRGKARAEVADLHPHRAEALSRIEAALRDFYEKKLQIEVEGRQGALDLCGKYEQGLIDVTELIEKLKNLVDWDD